MIPRATAGALFSALFLLASCRATSAVAPLPAPTESDVLKSFAAGRTILEGFDSADGDDFRVGDTALYGIRLDDPDGTHASFVRAVVRSGVLPASTAAVVDDDAGGTPLLVSPSFSAITLTRRSGEKTTNESGFVVVEITVYDESGARTGRSFIGAPERFLRAGFFGPCRRAKSLLDGSGAATLEDAMEGGADPETERALGDEFLTMIAAYLSFLETFRSSPDLESLRRRIADSVVEEPSLLSVVFKGLTLQLRPSLETVAAETRALPAPSDDAIRYSTTMRLNDTLALVLDLAVVESRPPLAVVAGVIALDAAHPSHPERRFAARLLATRRGPATIEAR